MDMAAAIGVAEGGQLRRHGPDLRDRAACGTLKFCKNCGFQIQLDLIRNNSTIISDVDRIVGLDDRNWRVVPMRQGELFR